MRRVLTKGEIAARLVPTPGTGILPARVWAKIDQQEDGCWRWLARIDRYGYGQYMTTAGESRKSWKAHRFVYHCLVGEIPEGLTLDHACAQTWCVNPAHLHPMTSSDNLRQRNRPDPTMCAAGKHPWIPENIRSRSRGNRSSRCRPCWLEGIRQWKAARKIARAVEVESETPGAPVTAEPCPNCTDAYACGPCVWNAGPYTEDEIREAFEALGDETNQDDLMYRLHWSSPQRAVDTGSDPAAANRDRRPR